MATAEPRINEMRYKLHLQSLKMTYYNFLNKKKNTSCVKIH